MKTISMRDVDIPPFVVTAAIYRQEIIKIDQQNKIIDALKSKEMAKLAGIVLRVVGIVIFCLLLNELRYAA